MGAPTCMHCNATAALTTGREIYPHMPWLHGKYIWKCPTPGCGSYVGCHPGTATPLGKPANKVTRHARMALHNERFDPIWRKAKKGKRRIARTGAYRILAKRMGLSKDEAHISLFTIEQCRAAWRALEGVTTEDAIGCAK